MPPRRSAQSRKQQQVALKGDAETGHSRNTSSPSQNNSPRSNNKSTGTSLSAQNAATIADTTTLPVHQTYKEQIGGSSVTTAVTTVVKSSTKTLRMATKMPSEVSHHSPILGEEFKGKKRAHEAVEDDPKPANTSSEHSPVQSKKVTVEDCTESDADVNSNEEQYYSEQPMKYLKRQTESELERKVTQHVSQKRKADDRDTSLNEESSESTEEDEEVDDVEMEDEVDGDSGLSSAQHSAASHSVHQSVYQSPEVSTAEERRGAVDNQSRKNVQDDRHWSELRRSELKQRPSASSAGAAKLPQYRTQVYGNDYQNSVRDQTGGRIASQTASSGSTRFETYRSNTTPDYGGKSFPSSCSPNTAKFSVSSPKGLKELTLMQMIGRLLQYCLVLLVIVIVAAFIVIVCLEQLPHEPTKHLPSQEETATEQPLPPEENGNVLPIRQLKYFRVRMAKLRQQFPSQTDRFWLVLEAATEPIITQSDPTHPAVIMLVAAGVANNSAADCLAEQYAQLVTKTFQSQQHHSVFDSHVSDDAMKPDQVKRELDNQFTHAFETGAKAGIVRHVEKLPGEAAMIFYRFCDNDNAPFKDVSIVLTLTLESNDPGNERDSVAYKELRSVWKTSLDVDKVEPLLSRIGNSVAFVRPESHQHLESIGCLV